MRSKDNKQKVESQDKNNKFCIPEKSIGRMVIMSPDSFKKDKSGNSYIDKEELELAFLEQDIANGISASDVPSYKEIMIHQEMLKKKPGEVEIKSEVYTTFVSYGNDSFSIRRVANKFGGRKLRP